MMAYSKLLIQSQLGFVPGDNSTIVFKPQFRMRRVRIRRVGMMLTTWN
jgi:hypothetical protein